MAHVRQEIVEYCRKMSFSGLTAGTGGNISVFDREKGYAALTPSGVEYDRLKAEDIVICNIAGKVIEGTCRPTSEKELHLALYRRRDNINAVVHVHSRYATTLACLGWEIPPLSYLVAVCGEKVPLLPYAPFGTEELAVAVAEGIGNYNAVLMGNHGLLSVGYSLSSAYNMAETVEFLAGVYWRARCAGEPVLLSEKQISDAIVRFKDYGRQPDMKD